MQHFPNKKVEDLFHMLKGGIVGRGIGVNPHPCLSIPKQ